MADCVFDNFFGGIAQENSGLGEIPVFYTGVTVVGVHDGHAFLAEQVQLRSVAQQS